MSSSRTTTLFAGWFTTVSKGCSISFTCVERSPGRTSREAFEVNTGIDLNPPQSVEQGRFIVELKVAPSLPLTFLTIRLMQMGDRVSVVELR